MRLLYLALALPALLLLAACGATFPTSLANPISPHDALELSYSYQLIQAGIIGYEALPTCGTAQAPVIGQFAVCKTPAVVLNLKTLDTKAAPAVTTMLEVANNPANYPNISLQSAYGAALQLYDSLKATAKSSSVNTNGAQ